MLSNTQLCIATVSPFVSESCFPTGVMLQMGPHCVSEGFGVVVWLSCAKAILGRKARAGKWSCWSREKLFGACSSHMLQ